MLHKPWSDQVPCVCPSARNMQIRRCGETYVCINTQQFKVQSIMPVVPQLGSICWRVNWCFITLSERYTFHTYIMPFGNICYQYSMTWTSHVFSLDFSMNARHHMDLKSSWWSVPGSCLRLSGPNLATLCFLQLIHVSTKDPHMLRCSSAKPRSVWSLATHLHSADWLQNSQFYILFQKRIYQKIRFDISNSQK